MAKLPEWSAQALRYQGSDGPVKVMYFRSRLEVGSGDSFDQYYASPKQSSELGKQVSYQASGASDFRAFFSGHLFDPVEVFNNSWSLDSKNYILQGEECFEDRNSALEDLASKFNNISRVAPFDLESIYGPKFSYTGPKSIEPSKEEDLLWYLFLYFSINAKDNQDVQAQRQGSKKEGGKKGRGEGGKDKGGGEKKIKEVDGEKVKKEEKIEEEKEEDKETKRQDEAKKREDEERKKKKLLDRRIEMRGMGRPDVRRSKVCAFISGIPTKFNPSGMWIVEDFFYDEDEVE